MQVNPQHLDSSRYARCIEVSKRVRFEIERDVIRGRRLDFAQKFLPDGLSKLGAAASLTEAEKRFASQVQGRTYANINQILGGMITAQQGERIGAALKPILG
jgi:hypothetical protein